MESAASALPSASPMPAPRKELNASSSVAEVGPTCDEACAWRRKATARPRPSPAARAVAREIRGRSRSLGSLARPCSFTSGECPRADASQPGVRSTHGVEWRSDGRRPTSSLDEWNVEDAMEVLREVRELARGARASDCELWYWWSLRAAKAA